MFIYIYIYIYIHMEKTGNKSDNMKMYREEKNKVFRSLFYL